MKLVCSLCRKEREVPDRIAKKQNIPLCGPCHRIGERELDTKQSLPGNLMRKIDSEVLAMVG